MKKSLLKTILASFALLLVASAFADEKVSSGGAGNSVATSTGATVYFSRDISAESVMKLYEKVGKPLTGKVAVQQSMGEPGGYLFIQPELSAPLVKKLGATYINSTGVSDTVKIRREIAEEHGFTRVARVDIIDEDGDMELPVSGGSVLKKNIIGSHLARYDSLLVLTHFKGHAVSGIGGIMKNLSIGVSSPAGKRLIHSGGQTSAHYTHRDQTAFLEANAEAAKSVIEHFGGRVVYINFLFKLAAASDYGSSHPQSPTSASSPRPTPSRSTKPRPI